MRPSDRAWTVLAACVIGYEAACGPDELLSCAMDRYRKKHPFAAGAAVIYVAAHLLRVWPTRIDPLHQMAVKLK